jgi:hypothetical protein
LRLSLKRSKVQQIGFIKHATSTGFNFSFVGAGHDVLLPNGFGILADVSIDRSWVGRSHIILGSRVCRASKICGVIMAIF